MIFVTEVKMSPGGSLHEHIVEVKWRNSTTAATGKSSVAQMVEYISNDNRVQVEGPPAVNVGVHKPATGPKYIQTYADSTWTNNLLALPRYT